MDIDVIYNGQRLRLTRFWRNQKACLWITNINQRHMPKMQFVGGYPNEYCIFLEDLTDEEMAGITSLDGRALDLQSFLNDKK